MFGCLLVLILRLCFSIALPVVVVVVCVLHTLSFSKISFKLRLFLWLSQVINIHHILWIRVIKGCASPLFFFSSWLVVSPNPTISLFSVLPVIATPTSSNNNNTNFALNCSLHHHRHLHEITFARLTTEK